MSLFFTLNIFFHRGMTKMVVHLLNGRAGNPEPPLKSANIRDFIASYKNQLEQMGRFSGSFLR